LFISPDILREVERERARGREEGLLREKLEEQRRVGGSRSSSVAKARILGD